MLIRHRFLIFSLALALSVLLESVAYTYMQQEGTTFYYSSSVIYLLAGLVISFLPLFFNPDDDAGLDTNTFFYKLLPYLAGLFLIFLLVYHVLILAPEYKRCAIDKRWADMIPTIQLACKRFLSGQTVYGRAPEINPTAIIPYLPMVWLPFVPSVFFGFDPRWTTLSAVFTGLFTAVVPLLRNKRKIPFFPFVLTCVSLFLVLNYFLQKNTTFWIMTQEGVAAGLYMLLCFALLRRNFYFTGIMITLCLLSRYALVLWIPCYLLYVFVSEPKKQFLQLISSFFLSLLLLFLLPFFIHDPLYFLGLPANQAHAFNSFWENARVSQGGYYNVGFYKFFTLDQVWLMTMLEIITSFAMPALFFALIIWLKKKYPLNKRYIAYGSLKICLIFFYGFLAAPYQYIFFPAALISYVVAFDFLSQKRVRVSKS